MRIAIDAVGRLVVPKPLREQLGIHGPAELELEVADGRLELTVADVPARLEHDEAGLARIVADGSPPPLTADVTRQAVERGRR